MSKIKGDLDRRIKRTRQMIRDALIALIDEKGFESVTVQGITERADINRSTFYFHYKDKYDLLDQSTDEILQEFKEALKSKEVKGDEHCYFRNTLVHFEHIGKNAYFYKVMLGKNGIPHFSKQLKHAVEDAFYTNLVIGHPSERDLNIPTDILCDYVASAHLGLIEWWLEKDLSYSPDYMARLLNQLVKLGPLNAAGISRK